MNRFLVRGLCSMLSVVQVVGHVDGSDPAVQFRRLVLSEEFYSEGTDFADFNGDGANDIVSGPFWYEGPDFRSRHRYAPGERNSIKAYSDHFFAFAHDFNSDSRPDILVIGMPGQPAFWYENSGPTELLWKRHHVLDDVGSESPTLTDLTGDGKPELVCAHQGALGYAEPNWQAPARSWRFVPAASGKHGAFTHGLGVGDVDGDGRQDLLTAKAWFQQQPDPGSPFTAHPQAFAESGGAQMFSYDFDGDGDNDVVSVQNAHGWGLNWFERRGRGSDELWVAHPILPNQPSTSDRLSISQMHALALADIDGDGVHDLVTGKRFFAHGGGIQVLSSCPSWYGFEPYASRWAELSSNLI